MVDIVNRPKLSYVSFPLVYDRQKLEALPEPSHSLELNERIFTTFSLSVT